MTPSISTDEKSHGRKSVDGRPARRTCPSAARGHPLSPCPLTEWRAWLTASEGTDPVSVQVKGHGGWVSRASPLAAVCPPLSVLFTPPPAELPHSFLVTQDRELRTGCHRSGGLWCSRSRQSAAVSGTVPLPRLDGGRSQHPYTVSHSFFLLLLFF